MRTEARTGEGAPELVDLEHLGRARAIGAWVLGDVIVDPGPASCLDALTAGLAGRELHAGYIGRIVHSHQQDCPPAVVDHGYDSRQVLALRLVLGGHHHLLCCRQCKDLLFGELSSGILCRRCEGHESKGKSDGSMHDDFLFHDRFSVSWFLARTPAAPAFVLARCNASLFLRASARAVEDAKLLHLVGG